MTEARALHMAGVTVRLGGAEVLSGVDLEVVSGKWLGVVGPNGAGKSTMLRSIVGLAPLASGEIRIANRPMSQLSHSTRAKEVALVAQEPVIPVGMSVRDYVLLGRNPHIPWFAVETARDVQIVHELIDALELGAFAPRPVQTLSGGERQRAVIARALAQEAALLLLDEPTTGLDIGHVQEALELVDRMRLERGLTIVSAMHDLTLASQYAESLVMLDRGRVVAQGAPVDVLTEERLSEHYRARVHVQVADAGAAGVVVTPTRPRSIPTANCSGRS
ncbi:MAG TPA: ABC transporter ATP-binding protein [Acidimicrobiales bacterium]|nr:ABC transporter ATP-binding protein [Acidimicrobiales bacterium]